MAAGAGGRGVCQRSGLLGADLQPGCAQVQLVRSSLQVTRASQLVAWRLSPTTPRCPPPCRLFPSQAAFLLILLRSNRAICVQSPALRKGYTWAARRLLLPALHALGAAAASAGGAGGAGWLAGAQAVASAPPERVCALLQAVLQLVVGFWVPVALAYRRELRARLDFLRARGAPHFPELRRASDVLSYALPVAVLPWTLGVLLWD